MINRKKFYDTIRQSLFGGKISPSQVSGMDDVISEWESRNLVDLRQLAYVLATMFHETGRKMQPVREYGGEKYLKSKPYYPYYGRDILQTTWRANYEKVKKFSGIDVVSNPELIGQMPLAAKVAVEFMIKGYYTGKKLSDYFSPTKADWLNARRIINGTDRQALIAGYAKEFYEALV